MNAFTSVTNNADAAPLTATATPDSEVQPRRHLAAPVQIDAEEDRLGEEREALQRERAARSISPNRP